MAALPDLAAVAAQTPDKAKETIDDAIARAIPSFVTSKIRSYCWCGERHADQERAVVETSTEREALRLIFAELAENKEGILDGLSLPPPRLLASACFDFYMAEYSARWMAEAAERDYEDADSDSE